MILLSALVAAGAALFILAPLMGWRVPAAFDEPDSRADRRDELLHRRQEILSSIKDLDLEFETGKLNREDYDQVREGLNRQAVEIYREMDGRASDAAG